MIHQFIIIIVQCILYVHKQIISMASTGDLETKEQSEMIKYEVESTNKNLKVSL